MCNNQYNYCNCAIVRLSFFFLLHICMLTWKAFVVNGDNIYHIFYSSLWWEGLQEWWNVKYRYLHMYLCSPLHRINMCNRYIHNDLRTHCNRLLSHNYLNTYFFRYFQIKFLVLYCLAATVYFSTIFPYIPKEFQFLTNLLLRIRKAKKNKQYSGGKKKMQTLVNKTVRNRLSVNEVKISL